jgi:hypothetical protein
MEIPATTMEIHGFSRVAHYEQALHSMICCDYIERLKSAFLGHKIIMSAFLTVEINLAQQQSNNPARYHRFLASFLDSVVSTRGSLDFLGGHQFLHSYERHLFVIYGGWNGTLGGGCTRFQTSSNFPVHADDDDRSCRVYVSTGKNEGKAACTKSKYSAVVKEFKESVTLCGDLNSQKVDNARADNTRERANDEPQTKTKNSD